MIPFNNITVFLNMEKRIGSKLDNYIDAFKQDIRKHVETNDKITFDVKSELLQFIYDYEKLSLDKDDFTKRKRVKSTVPQYLRCTAKRANGEQCTRKKKDELCFCGTHDKNRPHGIIDKNMSQEPILKKTEVWLQEINGILYYIDGNKNIYKSDDILSNKTNPNIIANYIIENGLYAISK